MLQRIFSIARIFFILLLAASCAKKDPVDAPVVLPPAAGPTTPFVPPVVHPSRIQFNSGSKVGTSTNAFKTSLSLGNSASDMAGTTTHGYRVQYNVQNPNSR